MELGLHTQLPPLNPWHDHMHMYSNLDTASTSTSLQTESKYTIMQLYESIVVGIVDHFDSQSVSKFVVLLIKQIQKSAT